MDYQNITACKKSVIFNILARFSDKEVRREVNEVIAKTRGLDISDARWAKVLRKNEVEEVLRNFGEIA